MRKTVSNPWNTTSEVRIPGNSEAVGNEYNFLLNAQGSTYVDYIPDGKYEINCHYDIDFSNFNYETVSGEQTVILSSTRHTGSAYDHEVCKKCGYIKSGLTPHIKEWKCPECFTVNTNMNGRYTVKYYLTFTSKDVETITSLDHKSAIDLWRGYVNDKNTVPTYTTSVKAFAKNPGASGFNVFTSLDEKHPDEFRPDYELPGHKTHN